MQVYQTKTPRLHGTDYREIHSRAHEYYRALKKKTKRRPYIRSVYFHKEKIFLDYYWQHIWQKNWRDRVRRQQYYPCALELIRQSRFDPISKENPNDHSEILHRFAGITPDKELFFVQISEDKRKGHKCFMSVFPEAK